MSPDAGTADLVLDRFVEALDGSVQSVLTVSFGTVVDTPEQAFCLLAGFLEDMGFGHGGRPNRAERRRYRPA